MSIAFPSLERTFAGADRAQVALTMTVYATMLAAFLLPGGRIADYVGRRKVFLGAFAGFGVASLACAVSGSLEVLVIARVLQGACAAFIAPASLALALASTSSDRSGYVIGVWSAAAGAAAVAGPALGGAMVYLVSWRLIFLVNVPISAAVVSIGMLRLRETRDPGAMRPDLWGVLLATGAAGLLTAGLFQGAEMGWAAWGVWLSFGGAGVLALATVLRSRLTRNPLIGIRILGNRQILAANCATFLVSAAGYGLMLTNVLFLTGGWNYSALQLGLAVSPGPIVTAICAAPAGRLSDRFGPAAAAVPGSILLAAGALWFFLQAGDNPSWLESWLPGSLLTGIGIGLAFPSLGLAAVSPAAQAMTGTAIALNGVMRQVGAVAGLATVVTLVGKPTHVHAVEVTRHGWLFVVGLASLAAAAALPLFWRQWRHNVRLGTSQGSTSI